MKKIRNQYDVRIKCACMSCSSCTPDIEGQRCCQFHGIKVFPDDYCSNYEVKSGLLKAGKGDGRVKNKRYLDYLVSMNKENLKRGSKKNLDAKDVEASYMEKYGSIYIKI